VKSNALCRYHRTLPDIRDARFKSDSRDLHAVPEP
jgi:hypothetical protein